MPPAPTTDTHSDYAKTAGEVPIPGYTLVEPLGRGGFGEVWKCVAPGGLHKAVKFVCNENGDGSQYRQELAAFEQIKAIRHPFLLSLERVEVVGADLVMVMELADYQLQDRFRDCRAAGLSGVPRDELLGYFAEAAEALDVISDQYGLQHLDVKPANLFVTAGHVKVGDYGLVTKLGGAKEPGENRGLTPKYVAPEVLRGSVHTRSDQYSLALVYFELLTGGFPYVARTAQQMMLAHVSSPPDVSALPACDQSPVWTALSKKPEDRFPSCLDFVRALVTADYVEEAGDAPVRPVRGAGGGSTVTGRLTRFDHTPGPGELTGRLSRPGGAPRTATGEMTKNVTLKTLPRLTTAGQSRGGASGLVTVGGRSSITPPPPPPATYRAIDEDLPLAEPEPAGRVRLDPIRSVVATAQLLGDDTPPACASPAEFIAEVVAAAAPGGHVPQIPGDLGRLADGTWVCQFPSTVPAQVVPLKLNILRETWGVTVEQPAPDKVVLRRGAPGGFWGGVSKKAGLEVVVQLPKAGRSIGEVTVTGAVYGSPDKDFVRTAQDALPKLLADVRRELGNVEDRRRSPRLAAAFPLTIYPLHSDGTVDVAVGGKCREVSAGGLSFATDAPLGTKYAFVEFGGVVATAGLAVLVRVVRSQSLQVGQPPVYGVQYRTDL